MAETETTANVQQQTPTQENSKELNFRKQEAMYQKMLAEKEARIAEIEKQLQQRQIPNDDQDDDDSEPYVDKKRLAKKLSKFGESTQSEIKKAMEYAKEQAKHELKQEMWIENNPDFYEVMQNHAERFAQRAPKLAEAILKMPDTFERQKLVYQNIKELGIDKPEQKQPSIQDKIEANRRSPYYQPSGISNSPYSVGGDFSPSGQKNAYNKLQELKSKLRI